MKKSYHDTKKPIYSVLYRLMDSQDNASDSVDLLIQHIQSDLQALLNTRSYQQLQSIASQEVSTSILQYGVPDFSFFSLDSEKDQETLRSTIQNVIKQYEPRLSNTTVTLLPSGANDHMIYYKISAVLKFETQYYPINFKSYVDPEVCLFNIQEDINE